MSHLMIGTMMVSDLTMSDLTMSDLTMGDYAHQILVARYDKICHLLKAVLQDCDPEPLHQMRVSTRRLRSAMQLFAPDLCLHPQISTKIKYLTQHLGRVRDYDVLLLGLGDRPSRVPEGAPEKAPALAWQTELSPDLHQALIRQLKQQRRHAFKHLQRWLKQGHYAKLQQRIQAWLTCPDYTRLAQRPVLEQFPARLLPNLASFLGHEGWWEPWQPAAGSWPESLHELRKLGKAVRYQLELAQEVYGPELKPFLGDLKQIQQCLGCFHDAQILQLQLLEIRQAYRPSKSQRQAQPQLLPELLLPKLLDPEAIAQWQQLQCKYQNYSTHKPIYQLILTGS